MTVAGEHLPLELEAQDDVERVRDLVGVDADHARRDAVERAVELVERDARELLGERLLEPRVEEAPGREAAPDDVLPEPALRLVEARRGAFLQRRAEVPRVDLALVDAVPELVQARQEPPRLSGSKRVVRRMSDSAMRHGERVDGVVEPPRLVVHPPAR